MKRIYVSIFIASIILCACSGNAVSPPSQAEVSDQNSDGSDAVDFSEGEMPKKDQAEGETDNSETSEAEEPDTENEAAKAKEETMGTYSVKDCEFTRDGMKIYGKLYVPDGQGPYPAVILGHGFGADLSMMQGYADSLAKHGYIAYPFDFIGGGANVKSDGKLTEMSVLTEAADMSAVLDGIKMLDVVDTDNVILLGASQGGFVATYVAGKRPDDIKGLIALYPAYVLQDDSRKRTDNGKNILDTFSVMDVTIGRKYDEDALSFDIYDVMKDYTGDAYIIHGTSDSVVPYSYSIRAAENMPDAELVPIEGAGHVFFGKDDEYATELILSHLDKLCGRGQ